jgi:hypothetical protein
MSVARLEYAEKRMRKQWYEMVMAGERGASLSVLERMYDSYMKVLEEYLRCYEEEQREEGRVAGKVDTNQCA